MIGRRKFVALLASSGVAWNSAGYAQSDAKVRRIGILMGLPQGDSDGSARLIAFRQVLEESGWIEGRNIRIDEGWAGGDLERFRALSKELVAQRPDILVAHSTISVRSLLRESKTIPIVFVQVSDPLSEGFVHSFASPGGLLTGFTNFEYLTISTKWLEVLRQFVPGVNRIGILFNPDTTPYGNFVKPFQEIGTSLGVSLLNLPVRSASEIENLISELRREAHPGLIVLPDTFIGTHREIVIAAASRYAIPSVYPFRYFAAGGGLVSYGIDPVDIWRRVATYVVQILKGAHPGDLPVQAPTKYELVINLKTAGTLGLAVPPNLLALADEVIE